MKNGVTRGRRELQGWQMWKAAVDLRKNWGIGKSLDRNRCLRKQFKNRIWERNTHIKKKN